MKIGNYYTYDWKNSTYTMKVGEKTRRGWKYQEVREDGYVDCGDFTDDSHMAKKSRPATKEEIKFFKKQTKEKKSILEILFG